MSTRKVAIPVKPVTLQEAVDAFLSSPRCENANTRRAYATVIDKLTARLGHARELAQISDSEIADALHALWDDAAASTWNRYRAAAGSWLSWCQSTKRWPAPALPSDCERRAEHADHTSDLP
jgi:Phage integrase, N-terminal SAM-like domain